MKRYFSCLCIIMVMIINFTLFAKEKTNGLEKKKVALQSMMGSLVSLKYHFSEKKAIRMGVTLSGKISDYSSNDRNSSLESLQEYQNSSDSKDGRITFKIEYLHYYKPDSRVTPYFGVGPLLNYSRRNYTSKRNELSKSESQLRDYQLGLGSLLGVEYFFNEDISLCIEYNISLYYQNRRAENDYHSYSESQYVSEGVDKTNTFGLDINSVKFGVAIYL